MFIIFHQVDIFGWNKAHRIYTHEDFSRWAKIGNKILKERLNNDPEFKKQYIEKIKRTKHSPESIAKRASHPGSFTGKKHTEETKQKMSQTSKKNGSQKGTRNSQFGTCWIFNDNLKQSKKIDKNDLQTWIDNGWNKGRKEFNLSNESKVKMSHKGMIWITNGIQHKKINNINNIPEGWWRGRK